MGNILKEPAHDPEYKGLHQGPLLISKTDLKKQVEALMRHDELKEKHPRWAKILESFGIGTLSEQAQVQLKNSTYQNLLDLEETKTIDIDESAALGYEILGVLDVPAQNPIISPVKVTNNDLNTLQDLPDEIDWNFNQGQSGGGQAGNRFIVKHTTYYHKEGDSDGNTGLIARVTRARDDDDGTTPVFIDILITENYLQNHYSKVHPHANLTN